MSIRKTAAATGTVLGTEGPIVKTADREQPWQDGDEERFAAENTSADQEPKPED